MSARIIIADNHKMVADGLANVIGRYKGLKVISVVNCGLMLLEDTVKLAPDLLLLDLDLPVLDGEALLPIIKKAYPSMKIVLLTSQNIIHDWKQMLLMSLDGIVLKSIDEKVLINGMRQVLSGGVFIDPLIQAQIEQPNSGAFIRLPYAIQDEISKREAEVLLLILSRLTSREIAVCLGMSSRTADKHRESIYKKLGVKSVKAAIDLVHQHQRLELEKKFK